eukprot:Unigene7740_Nuclearia_a/m.23766 Unigene7740_Nuclearia_a/g.23766  ORF Unigene7740_Nuclearia_a/g.23766 Unigene7740_Nuclearia_a/m.23766 type:complete len:476 (-) Unigene7740_Nuclearia_a:59-1486(-)
MALLTDSAYVIQQIRLAALHNDGPLAERVIMTNGPLDGSSFNESMYEHLSAAADKEDASPKRRNSKNAANKRQSRALQTRSQVITKPPVLDAPPAKEPPPGKPSFTKQPVKGTATPRKSALAELIKAKSGIHNAYRIYAHYCGKGEAKPIRLMIWLPFSSDKKTPLEIIVKSDATVEDVIGYTLYEYTDQGRHPPVLDVLHAYSLRIVEDNGVIDDDFPALERSRQIEKFSFDQFALVEAPRQQVLAAEEAKRQKQQKSGHILLKIHLYSTLEIKQTSTISATTDQLLSDLLRVLCEKHKLNMEEYTLRMDDTKTDLPLNKTVGEVQVATLCLMKKYSHSAGDIFLRPAGERPIDDAEEKRYSEIMVNEHLAYKKYNVTRRLPLFGGKQERILAIDGDLVHNMPGDSSRGFFESQKTTSIHVSSIVSIETRVPSILKLVYRKDREQRVYELETQNPEEAEEIVSRINRLISRSRS